MKTRHIGLVLAACAGISAFAQNDETIKRRLRGYGETSAERSGDDVTIRAESPEKARLWAARYLHVHGKEGRVVKDGVVKLPDGTFDRVAVDGKTVTITHSASEPAASHLGTLPEIPMFLNSWDDYCFRFYYWPGQSPKGMGFGGKDWGEYDPRGEFDFAKKCDDAGFIFWCDSQPNGNAKGLMDNQLWNWGYKLAKDRHLPIVLNTNFSVPFWYLDEHRELNERHAPQFIGTYHSVGEPNHAHPFLSWASSKGHRDAFEPWLDVVRKYDCNEVIELLEPHGELNHGDYTVFIEHGPLADRSFRTYMRERYGEAAAVANRWKEPSVKSWGDVRLPEIADFAGWGPDAVDLSGDWRGRPLAAEDGSSYPARLNQDRQQKNVRAPKEWLDPACDDSSWPLLYRGMPGNEIGYLYEKRPAVIRRHFNLPARKGRTWLYVWDLSQATGSTVAAHVNGKLAGESGVGHASCHWMHCEVTDLLKDGDNVIALELPHGVINYRIYLTQQEPKAYPYFGEGMNAKWVDFCGWQEWSRMRAVKTGLESLRSVEPDKSIVAMAPGSYFNSMRKLAMRYGSRFHDTGMTAAAYWEFLPMLMRSADMPFSVEPGSPAGDLNQFRRYFNLYLREGVNAVHYFIHVGTIMWKDDIRAEFERILPAIKMMGRMSSAPTDVAFVMDSRIEALMGYPWRSDPNSAFPSGYPDWRLNETLKDNFQMDAVTPGDVSDALASRYRFLIDCNNTVMTPKMAEAVERYVRAGGTYVAMFQSGRHTPEKPDQWVLSSLAGCRVKDMSRYYIKYNPWGASTEPEKRVKVRRAADEHWNGSPDATLPWEFWADGTFLEPTADDVEVLYRWCDGENEAPTTPAIVSRRIGEGRIITFGTRARYYDVETRILDQMLIALGATRIPVVAPDRVHARHFITTDGTKDVWLLANERWDGDVPYELKFRDGAARELTDVLTGRPAETKGVLGPNGFLLATSPRSPEAQAQSAWHWVKNQFGWWRGAEVAKAAPAAREEHSDVLEIGSLDWKVTFAGSEKPETRPLEPWVVGRDIPEGVTEYTCERDVQIPAEWNDGDVELWGVGQYSQTYNNAQFWVYLDGKEIHYSDGGIKGRVLDVKAGETAHLKITVKDDRHPGVRGFRGVTFLRYRPKPAGTLSLAGEWQVFERMTDVDSHTVTLPGRYDRGVALRREFDLPSDVAGRTVRVDFTSRGDFLHGVVVNGHYVRRHHHRHGDRTILNITPYLKPGAKNEIWLVGNYFGEWARSGEITDVKLEW